LWCFRGLVGAGLLVVTSAAAGQTELGGPEPAVAPPRIIEERGPSPVYYRLPNDTVLPTVRLGLGASFRLPVYAEPYKLGFVFNGLPGVAFGLGRGSRYAFMAEGGYSYVGPDGHWFVLGLGPEIRRFGTTIFDDGTSERPHGDMALGVIPHGLVGTIDDAFAGGVRTSAYFRFMAYAIVVAHQYTMTELRHVHEIHLTFSPFYVFGVDE